MKYYVLMVIEFYNTLKKLIYRYGKEKFLANHLDCS